MITELKEFILPIIMLLPLAGMLLVLFTPRGMPNLIRHFALWSSVVTFGASLVVWFSYVPNTEMQFVYKLDWINLIIGDKLVPITFQLGVDGINILMLMLTTFITPIAILASWENIQVKIKEYFALFLLLEIGMMGVFLAGDLFLFYVFWEIVLIPMYLLIGIWGGKERIYAAIKFVIFTMVGSLLMLVAIIFLAFASGANTFSIAEITTYLLANPLDSGTQLWVFIAFFLAFAIKVPLFPFHTWLPDAHTQAPTAGSVILAGVLLKMGGYGFVRFAIPMFPNATVDAMPTIMVLSLIGIIYGALVAMVQPDAKRLVAYSSVAHMGFVMIGLFALNMQGLQGGMLQMVNHGLSTGALFICVGILYDRRHTRMIADFGGVSKVMPVFATLFLIVTLSSIGLPGLNGFVGEFLSMLGAFQAHWIYGVVASIGVILAAVYMLWMFQRVMYGEITHEENEKLSDINTRELICLLPILFFIVWIGVYPGTFLEKMEPSLQHLLEQVEPVVEEHRPDHNFGISGTEMNMEMNMNEAEAGDGHGEE